MTAGEEVKETPDEVLLAAILLGLLAFKASLRCRRAYPDIAEQDWQHNQVGQDKYGDTDTGNQCQILNHFDLDDHQHGEANRIAQQRCQARHEQAAEGETRRNDLVQPATDVLHDSVHFLRAMAHADSKHQKGNQYRIWIELETQQGDQTQLPDHRDHGASHHQEGAASAAGVPEQYRRGNCQRCGEKAEYLLHTSQQVAYHLGKAGDMDADGIALIFLAQLLQSLGQLVIIQHLAISRGRQQGNVDDAGLLIEGHQLADLAGPLEIASQGIETLWRAVVIIWDYRSAFQPLFGDTYPASTRSP
ncbi:hypothetical protein D3C84_496810 [compost metagenome]